MKICKKKWVANDGEKNVDQRAGGQEHVEFSIEARTRNNERKTWSTTELI